MLKSDFGKVEIKGMKALIMAELSTLIFGLRETKTLTDEEIKETINDGFKSKEELDKEHEQLMNKERTTEEIQRIISNITAARKSGLTNDKDEKGIEVHYINADDLDNETKESLEDFLGKIMGE